MRTSVTEIFPSFSATFEGRVPWMYLDIRGLVTTGVGNLIDSVQAAQQLPWTIDGRNATDDEVADAWHAVKAATALERAGGGAFASLTNLRLSDSAIDALVSRRAGEMDAILANRFANWNALPADAQLATLSLAWACGPWFGFPKFSAALAAQDFATCATECQLDAIGNPGLVPRNRANAALFRAAQARADDGGDLTAVTGWPPNG